MQEVAGRPYLKLCFMDIKGVETNIITFETQNLKHAMSAYCIRLKIEREKFLFIYKNLLIKDTDTPKSLGMKDGDVVDAVEISLLL